MQFKKLLITACIFLLCIQGCQSQPQVQGKSMSLVTSVELPGVNGRIDHMAFDNFAQKIFVAALGNNTVEVVDLKNNKAIHSITNLNEPQGIAFIPERKAILVANGGNGRCDVFSSEDYQKITSIQLSGDADNVRYDAINKMIYVGYGDGGIAIIDANTFKQLGDIKLEGHPESFQLDIPHKKIYVNVPDKQQIEVIDLEKQQVTDRWKITEAKSNFPMYLDAVNRRLVIGCRRPVKLLVIDTETGKTKTSVETSSDVDDIFCDVKTGNLYLSCGGGNIDVFKRLSNDNYQLSEKIVSKSGARTSLWIPQLNRLVVASPKNIMAGAALLVYAIKD
ncbi:YncE family protein [Sediminibacterium roseum]|uniref:YncE family protein n=1 Tax=Sediminibacterium roseum TaxID=1978412 RepID=A0ABW9ZUT1_9BACT|nr:YncE family protein [Sediminibacterium roseum]NCI49798.1 YncE family protein [Sediminibacterium roseum]